MRLKTAMGELTPSREGLGRYGGEERGFFGGRNEGGEVVYLWREVGEWMKR